MPFTSVTVMLNWIALRLSNAPFGGNSPDNVAACVSRVSMVTLYSCGVKSPSSVVNVYLYWKYLFDATGMYDCFDVSFVTSANVSVSQFASLQLRAVKLRRATPRR